MTYVLVYTCLYMKQTEHERLTIIARSLTVEGVQVRAHLTIESQNGRNVIAASHVERIDGAEVSESLRLDTILAMVRAIAAESRAKSAARDAAQRKGL
jgi:hypothetical protein